MGGEPTGEPATPGHPDTVLDDRGNYTGEFGLTEPLSLGDTVWFDTNDNGLIDNGEAGANGVVVNL